MTLTLQREKILEPLQLIANVVERRHTMPILAHALLRTENDLLYIMATDTELEVVAQLKLATPPNTPIFTTVSAHKLIDICKTLPEHAELKIELLDGRLMLRSGRGRYYLAVLPAEEFPNFEISQKIVDFSIKNKRLFNILKYTSFAVAQQDVRYFLNGLFLEIEDNKIRAIASDGHRMALSEAKLENNCEYPHKFIIPRKTTLELQRFLNSVDEQTVNVTVGSNYIQFKLPNCTLTSKLIEGNFPAYRKVIPRGGDKHIIIEPEPLKQLLSRVAIVASEKMKGVRAKFSPGILSLSADNNQLEQGEEEIEIDYQGEPLGVGLNINYFIDVINHIPEGEMKLTLQDANTSMLIESVNDENTLYVIMPMRI